ncbi:MAG: glucan biosynthesis protein [Gammaproteobacteria bacterium]
MTKLPVPRAFTILIAIVLALLSAAGKTADLAQSLTPPGTAVADPFTFDQVVAEAARLAAGPFQPDGADLPTYFSELTYDQYRDIRFRSDQSIWRDQALPFRLQFFPRGFNFLDRVRINIVEAERVVPVHFQKDMFDFGRNVVPPDASLDVDFAGFRLLYPINRDDRYDEIAVFLGASYFRAVGQNQSYGITARGLAVDTGLSSQEEFPVFREFWIVQPDHDAVDITVYALMDSKSVAGAYRFVIRPGLNTVIEVKARLYLREAVQKIGLAPLTSMFYHGKTTERFMDDFRPEVHDSDGLLVETDAGERVWRPLINPQGLSITSFQVTNPSSYGLLQRERDFDHYQDLEALYHTRPSAVVEPLADWGAGSVELVQIPSTSERYDNVVAYWVPEQSTEAGQELELEYRLRFALDPEGRLLGGRTIATRIGAGGTDVLDPTRRKFVIDFSGPALALLAPESPVEAVVSASSGELVNRVVQPNPHTKGWRLFFELIPDGDPRPVDLRAFLRLGTDAVTETWSFQWLPN